MCLIDHTYPLLTNRDSEMQTHNCVTKRSVSQDNPIQSLQLLLGVHEVSRSLRWRVARNSNNAAAAQWNRRHTSGYGTRKHHLWYLRGGIVHSFHFMSTCRTDAHRITSTRHLQGLQSVSGFHYLQRIILAIGCLLSRTLKGLCAAAPWEGLGASGCGGRQFARFGREEWGGIDVEVSPFSTKVGGPWYPIVSIDYRLAMVCLATFQIILGCCTFTSRKG